MNIEDHAEQTGDVWTWTKETSMIPGNNCVVHRQRALTHKQPTAGAVVASIRIGCIVYNRAMGNGAGSGIGADCDIDETSSLGN